MSLAGTETPMDAHPPNDSSNNVSGTEMLSSNPEPVYRFYLSPPPTAPMQTGIPGYQTAQHQPQPQPMYPTSMGMMAYNPYMPMSPPPGPGPQGPPQMAGVGAFGQPAFYAQHTQHHHPHQHQHQHQAMYFPSAYGMAAMQMPNASAVSLAAPTPMPASSAGLTAPGNVAVSQAAASERGEVDLTRTRTPIVNEAGVPMGGFGLDRDGQYIEIKFPTFGQAQVQQMLQQLHISQQPQVQAQPVVTQVPVAVRPPAAKQQQQQEQPTQPATPVSSAAPVGPTPPPQATATVSASKLETTSSQSTGEISIYDAEGFANAHMEDIVFESKAFFWKIENWDKLERRATSEMFRCGGHMWRILLRPFGSSHKGVLSLFLECLGAVDSSEDWRCTCRFVLAVANPEEPEHNTHGAAYHCFHRNNPNWGFTRFMKLADLRTAQVPGVRPYIEDGACTIAAYLHVIKEPSQ